MTSAPSISVLVTVYNREKYLAECLDSILASSWQDFEVIVVDDGSTDASVRIAQQYQAKDPRVFLFQNEVNLGDYPNRNRAASLANGRWLKYVDSDDYITVDCLEKMVVAGLQFPNAKLILSYPRPKDKPRPSLFSPAESWREHFINKQGFFCSGPLLSLISADAFREVGGFRPAARNMGDTILWLELCRRYDLVITEPDLTFWRQHSEQEFQLVRDGGWDNSYTHCKLSCVLLRDFLDSGCPLSNSDILRIRKQIHLDNFRRLAWHIKGLRLPKFCYEALWAIRMLTGFYPECVLRNAS